MVGTGENPDWERTKMFIWNDAESRKVAQIEFYKPIIDLLMVGSWVLVAFEDRVVPLNLEKDFSISQIANGITTKINKRGLIDLYVDQSCVKIVVPDADPSKEGYALVTTINTDEEIKGQEQAPIKESLFKCISVDVTHDKKKYQTIKFVKNGSLLAAATRDGRMIKFVNANDGVLVSEVHRGKNSAKICSISVISTRIF